MLLIALAMLLTAAKPMQCPRSWIRQGITVTSTHVEFSTDQTIKAICVNGEKRQLRQTKEGLDITFQLTNLTGFVVFDASMKVK
jgi:hypothetical protein